MAVPDPSSPYKVLLLMEDYPYAVGRAGRLARHRAVRDGVPGHLLPHDGALQADRRRGAAGLVEGGTRGRHADLKDEPWWPKMRTTAECNAPTGPVRQSPPSPASGVHALARSLFRRAPRSQNLG
jgi:linoleate 9S-lipoxygenase